MGDTIQAASDTGKRKPKTARNPESIFKGALALPLEARVSLVKELKGSIEAEVKSLETKAAEAKQIVNGS